MNFDMAVGRALARHGVGNTFGANADGATIVTYGPRFANTATRAVRSRTSGVGAPVFESLAASPALRLLNGG
jgi:hypothetical protein